MTGIAQRIASLSPEKRAALFRQLQSKSGATTSATTPRTYREVRIGDGSNFRLRVRTPGVLESLEAVALERRTPGEGEVEVEVHAASLNFRDLMLALAIYPSTDVGEFNMGLDWSGRVVAVGQGVERLALGEEVVGLTPTDFSPYVTCNQAYVVRKPKSLSFVEAATIPTVFLTAYFALYDLARLGRGERVLIHSAAGGVGLAAIEVARWLGAEIYATAGNEAKRTHVRDLGVEYVFDSHSIEWADEIMAATSAEGVDVVLNSLSGEALARGFDVLRDSGRFVEVGLRDLMSDARIALRPFSRALSFMATGIVPSHRRVRRAEMLSHISDLLDEGQLRPIASNIFPIEDVVEAFSFMAKGVHVGKIALEMWGREMRVATE